MLFLDFLIADNSFAHALFQLLKNNGYATPLNHNSQNISVVVSPFFSPLKKETDGTITQIALQAGGSAHHNAIVCIWKQAVDKNGLFVQPGIAPHHYRFYRTLCDADNCLQNIRFLLLGNGREITSDEREKIKEGALIILRQISLPNYQWKVEWYDKNHPSGVDINDDVDDITSGGECDLEPFDSDDSDDSDDNTTTANPIKISRDAGVARAAEPVNGIVLNSAGAVSATLKGKTKEIFNLFTYIHREIAIDPSEYANNVLCRDALIKLVKFASINNSFEYLTIVTQEILVSTYSSNPDNRQDMHNALQEMITAEHELSFFNLSSCHDEMQQYERLRRQIDQYLSEPLPDFSFVGQPQTGGVSCARSPHEFFRWQLFFAGFMQGMTDLDKLKRLTNDLASKQWEFAKNNGHGECVANIQHQLTLLDQSKTASAPLSVTQAGIFANHHSNLFKDVAAKNVTIKVSTSLEKLTVLMLAQDNQSIFLYAGASEYEALVGVCVRQHHEKWTRGGWMGNGSTVTLVDQFGSKLFGGVYVWIPLMVFKEIIENHKKKEPDNTVLPPPCEPGEIALFENRHEIAKHLNVKLPAGCDKQSPHSMALP